MLKTYLKQDILFDLDVKFPLLRLLQFLSDIKSTNVSKVILAQNISKH